MSVQFPFSQDDSHQIPESGSEMKQSDNGLTAEATCLEIGEGESRRESRVAGLQSQISSWGL